MQKQRKYDVREIEELTDLLLEDGLYTGDSYRRIEDLLTDERYSDEVARALARVWDEIGQLEHDPRDVRSTTERTLAGIARRCPDFPAKPTQVVIPFYRRKVFRVAAGIVLPLLLLAGVAGLRYLSGTDDGPGPVISDNILPTQLLQDTTRTGFATDPETLISQVMADAAAPDTETTAGGNAVTVSGSAGEPETGDVAPSMLYVQASDTDREVLLPDGTRINLTAGSRLSYRSDFMDRREVTLSGNAFFSVARLDGKTFEVLYNDVTVSVLGTEFYLNEYDTTLEVTLKSGSVEILTADQSVILAPNQQFVMEYATADFTVIDLTDGQMAKMIRGRLEFHGTPMGEALRRTGEFFGVALDVSLDAEGEPVRLQFGEDDTLEDVLFILQSISGGAFDYEITPAGVRITGTGE